jgi:hypothetical protein
MVRLQNVTRNKTVHCCKMVHCLKRYIAVQYIIITVQNHNGLVGVKPDLI